MTTEQCRYCGAHLPAGAKSCPACGKEQRTPAVSRVWVLTFFVLGIAIGLFLLLLDQGGSQSWQLPEVSLPQVTGEVSAPADGSASKDAAKGAASHSEALRCDKEKAQAVHDKALELASIREQGDTVRLILSRQWEFYSPGHRRSFVEAYSEADHCLQGRLRELHFSYRGEEVAHVSATGAVVMK